MKCTRARTIPRAIFCTLQALKGITAGTIVYAALQRARSLRHTIGAKARIFSGNLAEGA
jgi:hypothetical protein